MGGQSAAAPPSQHRDVTMAFAATPPACSAELGEAPGCSPFASPRLAHKNRSATAAARLLAAPFVKPLSPQLHAIRCRQQLTNLTPGPVMAHPSFLGPSGRPGNSHAAPDAAGAVPRSVLYKRAMKELKKTASSAGDGWEKARTSTASLVQHLQSKHNDLRPAGRLKSSESRESLVLACATVTPTASPFPPMRRTSSCPVLTLDEVLGCAAEEENHSGTSPSALTSVSPLLGPLASAQCGGDCGSAHVAAMGSCGCGCVDGGSCAVFGQRPLDTSARLLVKDVAALMGDHYAAHTAALPTDLAPLGLVGGEVGDFCDPLPNLLPVDLGTDCGALCGGVDPLCHLNGELGLQGTPMDVGFPPAGSIGAVAPLTCSSLSRQILRSLDRMQEELDPTQAPPAPPGPLSSLAALHPPPMAAVEAEAQCLQPFVEQGRKAAPAGLLPGGVDFPVEYQSIVMGVGSIYFPDLPDMRPGSVQGASLLHAERQC